MARPLPQSYYYSGQGRLAIGDRDSATGKYSNIVFIGNVTSLEVDIATDKFDHKESMDGLRTTDVSFSKSNTATFKFTSESLILQLLAIGLYGDTSSKVAGAAVAEVHPFKQGAAIPLLNPNVSDVVVTTVPTSGSGEVLVEGTDYIVDEGFGTIYPVVGSAKVTAEGISVSIGYSHGAFDQVDVFTQAQAPEKYLRFEGLNTLNGDLRLIEIPRAQLDPLTGLEFINDELGSGDFAGSILMDPYITGGPGNSQFFRERRISQAQQDAEQAA